MKKYALEVFVDDDNSIAYHENSDSLSSYDVRVVMSVFEQIKNKMILALDSQAKLIIGEEPKKKVKAD